MSEAARIDLVDRAPLTEKQQNVYESIMQYQRVNGYAPTIREICKMVGVASTSSVYAHLKILEEKGYIARKMDASRARQQHIHTEKQDYYIDLVFYNYILKCFVLIDLKTEKIRRMQNIMEYLE